MLAHCRLSLLLLMSHGVAHLVAQTARLGRNQIIQRLDPLLFDRIQVPLLLLECPENGVLRLGSGRLFVGDRDHHIVVADIVRRERRNFRVDDEAVWFTFDFVAERLLVVSRISSLRPCKSIMLILVEHLHVAAVRFKLYELVSGALVALLFRSFPLTFQAGLVRLHEDLLSAYEGQVLLATLAFLIRSIVVFQSAKGWRACLVAILSVWHEHGVETQEGRASSAGPTRIARLPATERCHGRHRPTSRVVSALPRASGTLVGASRGRWHSHLLTVSDCALPVVEGRVDELLRVVLLQPHLHRVFCRLLHLQGEAR